MGRGEAKEGDEEETSEVAVSTEQTLVGTKLELDGIIGADGRTLDVNVSYNRDLAPPHLREVEAAEKGALLDAPTTSFHRAEVVTAITMLDGATRMLGRWNPSTEVGGEVSRIQAVFLKTELVYLDGRVDEQD